MRLEIRPADEQDCDLLIALIDQASEGVIPELWSAFAPAGVTATEVGKGLVLSEDGPFSFRNALIAEIDGENSGGMICYPITPEAAAVEPGLPEFIQPLMKLEARAVGKMYINVVATLPHAQGRGIGTALLARAEEMARTRGAPGVALIVAASNTAALRLYANNGFVEIAREPFDVSSLGHPPTEALLMIKPV